MSWARHWTIYLLTDVKEDLKVSSMFYFPNGVFICRKCCVYLYCSLYDCVSHLLGELASRDLNYIRNEKLLMVMKCSPSAKFFFCAFHVTICDCSSKK